MYIIIPIQSMSINWEYRLLNKTKQNNLFLNLNPFLKRN